MKAFIFNFSLVFTTLSAFGGFRVEPYLQNPTETAITVIWFSDTDSPGTLSLKNGGEYASKPVRADKLAYHEAERAANLVSTQISEPWMHRVRLENLEPGREYIYSVLQGGQSRSGTLHTAPRLEQGLRILVFADSEAEPESAGARGKWPAPGADPNRLYPADQRQGFAANLEAVAEVKPDLLLIAGDLVESGNEQRDWDEFWWHLAGGMGRVASSTVILPVLGNHENYGGPHGGGGYSLTTALAAVARYRTYFELPVDEDVPEPFRERFYRLDYGPVTIIGLDSSNGLPEGSEKDSNWHLNGAMENGTLMVPDFNPGSIQYQWLEKQLKAASETSPFIFVQFHHMPYSGGVHGKMPGDDAQSGYPLRVLTPLFAKYGVDAVFCGHCETYEHWIVDGIHFYDIGIGGDGLRPNLPKLGNSPGAERLFSAYTDQHAVVIDGQTVPGGLHYGHLFVEVTPLQDGGWRAVLTPRIVVPLCDEDGKVEKWSRFEYPDQAVIKSHQK